MLMLSSCLLMTAVVVLLCRSTISGQILSVLTPRTPLPNNSARESRVRVRVRMREERR